MAEVIICYAKCWPCQFGDHSTEPHTWMDSEDIEHEGMAPPQSPEDRAQLAAERPCGCHCNEANRSAQRSAEGAPKGTDHAG